MKQEDAQMDKYTTLAKITREGNIHFYPFHVSERDDEGRRQCAQTQLIMHDFASFPMLMYMKHYLALLMVHIFYLMARRFMKFASRATAVNGKIGRLSSVISESSHLSIGNVAKQMIYCLIA